MASDLQKQKKKLDAVFSRYIRLKYAKKEMCTCYTCGKVKHWKDIQNGHFIPRNILVTRFDENNCRPQCLTKESRLRMFSGIERSIDKIKKGDLLWGFNEKSFELEKAEVLNTKNFIPEKMYEIELENGEKFCATNDHKVVANGEWISIQDMLHSRTTYDIMEL